MTTLNKKSAGKRTTRKQIDTNVQQFKDIPSEKSNRAFMLVLYIILVLGMTLMVAVFYAILIGVN